MKRMHLLAATLAVVAAMTFVPASVAQSGSLPTLTVAIDGQAKTVTVGGAMTSGAVNVATTTTGEADGETVLVLLKPGADINAAFAAVNSHKGDINYLNPYGSVVFDADAPKGASSAQTTLQPGDYLALDASSNAAIPPHTTFTVTQAASPSTLPTPAATVSAIDFGFRGPSRLRDGELVRFQNEGFVVHMILYIGVKNRADARKVTSLLLAGKDKAAMKVATGGGSFAGPLSSGAMQQFAVATKPGIYVLACFMDAQDGREHTQLGMERTIQIVK
jgi:hypothetical protein